MPVYYATGSKWKALAWGTVAGFPLPVGGFIVSIIHVVLSQSSEAVSYGEGEGEGKG